MNQKPALPHDGTRWWQATFRTEGWASRRDYVRFSADPNSWGDTAYGVLDTGLPILTVHDLKRAVGLLNAEPAGSV